MNQFNPEHGYTFQWVRDEEGKVWIILTSMGKCANHTAFNKCKGH